MKVLIIDNYDSFTFNLYQFVGEILSAKVSSGELSGYELVVKRNDELSLDEVRALAPDRIIISPGSGSPEDKHYFGVCAEVISELGPNTPLLGVCLGMQGIVHVFGGKIVKAESPMHGKLSPIVHNSCGIFADIPQALDIMRYHSLVAENASLPDCLEISAYIAHGVNDFSAELKPDMEIMGVRHREYPIHGIQFHPESFASEGGQDMIANFIFQAV
ncbi:MAG: anthranilate synthase component 2 [Flavobacteriales bacterium]|jgi:anthranilate synthase component 2